LTSVAGSAASGAGEEMVPVATADHDDRAADHGDRAAGQRVRGSASGSVRRDLAELGRLVRVLEHHVPGNGGDVRRELLLIGEEVPVGSAEQHLRAVKALLVSLAAYQRRPARRPLSDRRFGRLTRHARPARNGSTPEPSSTSLSDLAAAAARYLARDLAARQLTEFTSAEGYRLARGLARIGAVEEPVERLLTEANRVRLHPMPLAETLSHSPH
jgi:hypothetical protein